MKAVATLPAVSIDEAMVDQNLLGAALGDMASWSLWVITLKAAFGLPLDAEETARFASVAGGRQPPTERVRELWAVVARRAGKSRIAAAIAAFIATLVNHAGKLSAGETGFVLVLAASKLQAKVVHGYCLGFLKASPVLSRLVAEVTADEIRLRNGIVIAIHPNSFRTTRGRTLLAVVFDEVSFWRSETTASPDREVYRAILPALATTGGMLVAISSPYRKVGLLFKKWQDHFGKDDAAVLAIQSDSRTLNPTLDPAIIAAAREEDPESARAEWDGEFRSDIATFVTEEALQACIEEQIFERPWRSEWDYHGFVDVAGGSGPDSMTLGIAHTENKTRILDCLREARPPFSPEAIAEEFAGVCRSYRITKMVGDRFAGEWPREQFRKHGVNFSSAERTKSEIYIHGLALINSGAIRLLDNRRMIVQLASLERRTGVGRKDVVDHPNGGHDDLANVAMGSLCLSPAQEDRAGQIYRPKPIAWNKHDPLAASR